MSVVVMGVERTKSFDLLCQEGEKNRKKKESWRKKNGKYFFSAL